MISDNRYFTITKLKYVNGFQRDTNNYIVSTTFTRVFKVSSKELSNKEGLGKSKSIDENLINEMTWDLAIGFMWGHFEPGDSFDEACEFRFLRTENGWILQSGAQTVIVNRHTEHADALDAREKQYRDTQRQKAADAAVAEANAAANERERHLVEVKNACASRQQMKIIGYGLLAVKGLQGAGPFGGYLGEGQVVVGVPDDARSLAAMADLLGPRYPNPKIKNAVLLGWLRGMCRVQYSVRNRIISGYVPVERLELVKQGDAKAQSNPGAMYDNGKASAQTTLAVIVQAGFPYSATPQDIYNKPPLGQFAFNMHLCVKSEMAVWNGLKFFQFILPSGETVYSEALHRTAITRDPAGDKNCASQGTTIRSGSENLDKPGR